MIINIRGCNGSGKTTLARSLLDMSTAVEIELGGQPVTLDRSLRVALIGPYIGRKTGGCDCLKTFEDIRYAVRVARAQYPVVVFEGVTVSTVYSSWAAFDDELNRSIVWTFLDTPLEVCLARIQERNGGKPIKEELVADKHRSIAKVREKVLADGRAVLDVGVDGADVLRRFL